MKHYLKDLYAILKILVAFTFLIFFSAFYFITDDYKRKQEEKNTFYCGVTSDPYYKEEDKYIPDSTNSNFAIITHGKELFEANCTACHAVHKVKVGPALKDITKRRDTKWIVSFVKNPMKKIKVEKDPYAVALYDQYNQTEMTAFTTLSEKDIEAIVYYISH